MSFTNESQDHSQSLEFWSNIYSQENLIWQRDTPNPILVDNVSKLTGGQSQNIFVPLGGKSVDIPYLLNLGHRVFSIDVAEKAILDLNEKFSLGLRLDKERSTYKSEDGRLQFYCGDFVKCPIEDFGLMDCVWDRAAFTAIDIELRPAYLSMMKRALIGHGHKFSYLLETVDYDREKFDGPPFALNETEIQNYFGDWSKHEILNVPLHPDVDWIVEQVSNLRKSEISQVLYMFSPK